MDVCSGQRAERSLFRVLPHEGKATAESRLLNSLKRNTDETPSDLTHPETAPRPYRIHASASFHNLLFIGNFMDPSPPPTGPTSLPQITKVIQQS